MLYIFSEGNPLPSCQAVYEKDPNSRSGPYWLMVNGVKFKVIFLCSGFPKGYISFITIF